MTRIDPTAGTVVIATRRLCAVPAAAAARPSQGQAR